MSDAGVFQAPAENGERANQTLEGADPLIVDELRRSVGWSRFVVIMSMITGCLSCLSIIGAAWGVPMIIGAIRGMEAADTLKAYVEKGEMDKALKSMGQYAQFWRLTGIGTLILLVLPIAFYILIIIGFIVFGASFDFLDLP
jgi:hypothetical protein